MPEDYIRTGEFDRTMETLNERIDKGFGGIHTRFDTLEPRVLEHATKIAVLEYQAQQAHDAAIAATAAAQMLARTTSAQAQSNKTSNRNRAAAWGSGAAAFVWGAIEIVKVVKTLVVGH